MCVYDSSGIPGHNIRMSLIGELYGPFGPGRRLHADLYPKIKNTIETHATVNALNFAAIKNLVEPDVKSYQREINSNETLNDLTAS